MEDIEKLIQEVTADTPPMGEHHTVVIPVQAERSIAVDIVIRRTGVEWPTNQEDVGVVKNSDR